MYICLNSQVSPEINTQDINIPQTRISLQVRFHKTDDFRMTNDFTSKKRWAFDDYNDGADEVASFEEESAR
jgi:hypothetical protein